MGLPARYHPEIQLRVFSVREEQPGGSAGELRKGRSARKPGRPGRAGQHFRLFHRRGLSTNAPAVVARRPAAPGPPPWCPHGRRAGKMHPAAQVQQLRQLPLFVAPPAAGPVLYEPVFPQAFLSTGAWRQRVLRLPFLTRYPPFVCRHFLMCPVKRLLWPMLLRWSPRQRRVGIFRRPAISMKAPDRKARTRRPAGWKDRSKPLPAAVPRVVSTCFAMIGTCYRVNFLLVSLRYWATFFCKMDLALASCDLLVPSLIPSFSPISLCE